MFGEEISESPRQPSPWRTLSNSPSPYLRSPLSTPGTPESPAPTGSGGRRQPSLESLLSAGLSSNFGSLSLEGSVTTANIKDIGGGLSPEVDQSGHIEYKFKLPKPSPLRLAKLVTQLKWRLIEGGGIACYELGVLDNGTVVGLNRAEMAESLETLGTMLSALGGGKIKVARVVKFGGASGEETSDSGGDTSSSDAAPHLFESFEVEAIDQPAFFSSPLDDIYNPTSTPTSVLFPSLPHPGECANNPNPTPPPTPPTSVLFTAPTLAAVTNTPNHDRTPEERAMLKRVKRDARRARRESESDAAQGANSSPKTRRVPLSPHQSSRPSPHHQNHQPHDSGVSQPVKIKGVSTNRPKPKPNSPKQLSKSAPALNHIQPRKPTLPQENGEVRYVIEAVVSKRSGRTSGTGRRNERERSLSVSTSVEDVDGFHEDEDELDGQFFNDEEGGENEEEGEGWKYLNFDSLQL